MNSRHRERSSLLFLTLSAGFLGPAERGHSQEAVSNNRARDIGIGFEGTPGTNNAITDVAGVRVGYATLVHGESIRTGVTAILPRGDDPTDPVFAGWYALNGNGEMTGTTWIEESGFLEGPVCITNTHSVGVVRDAVIAWQVKNKAKYQSWSLPVVAETYDGWLNDTDGFHVKPEHVFAALDGATGGKIAEGNVGGGTGMMCLGFKGGTGTASRKLRLGRPGVEPLTYHVGVLVQSNFGSPMQLRIDGVPVGRELRARSRRDGPRRERGSIIVIVATDAPLVAHQLKRIARRVPLGIARVGGIAAKLGRHLLGVLDSEPEGRPERGHFSGRDARQRLAVTAICRDHAGDGGSDHQRDGRGETDDRQARSPDRSAPPRAGSADPQEVRAPEGLRNWGTEGLRTEG